MEHAIRLKISNIGPLSGDESTILPWRDSLSFPVILEGIHFTLLLDVRSSIYSRLNSLFALPLRIWLRASAEILAFSTTCVGLASPMPNGQSLPNKT